MSSDVVVFVSVTMALVLTVFEPWLASVLQRSARAKWETSAENSAAELDVAEFEESETAGAPTNG